MNIPFYMSCWNSKCTGLQLLCIHQHHHQFARCQWFLCLHKDSLLLTQPVDQASDIENYVVTVHDSEVWYARESLVAINIGWVSRQGVKLVGP